MKSGAQKNTLMIGLITGLILTTRVFAAPMESREPNSVNGRQQQENWAFLQSLSRGSSSIDLWLNELLSEQQARSKEASLAEKRRQKLKHDSPITKNLG